MTNLDDAAWRRAEANGEIADLNRRAAGEHDDAEEAAEVARLERELELAKQQDAADKLPGGDAFAREIAKTANKSWA